MHHSISAIWIAMAFVMLASPRMAVAMVSVAETNGPYRVVMDVDSSFPDHTIFGPDNRRSENRESDAAAMPVLLWANGGCAGVPHRPKREFRL